MVLILPPIANITPTSHLSPLNSQLSTLNSHLHPSPFTLTRCQGYLYKKAGNSKLSQASRYLNQDSSSRRYFVLRGTQLYYFKSWEVYGSLGFGGAVNKNAPIDMLHHIPTIAQETSDGTRFDLVPQGVRMHTRVCIHMHTAHACAHTCMCICVYACMCVHMHVRTRAHTCACIHVRVHTHAWRWAVLRGEQSRTHTPCGTRSKWVYACVCAYAQCICTHGRAKC